MLDIHVITLFPEIFNALDYGICGRALHNQQAQLTCWNPRDFTHDTHRTVDDRPFGGGPGMLMKPEPLAHCIEAAQQATEFDSFVIYLSPKGEVYNQQKAHQLANSSSFILLVGRYEGIDQRIIDYYVDLELSIGDFVLSGGEFAALSIIDSVIRLLPEAVGNPSTTAHDSFSHLLLEHPQYTRPRHYLNQSIPDVLLSGNHELIERWQLKQALATTFQKRPDLLNQRSLSPKARRLLLEWLVDKEYHNLSE